MALVRIAWLGLVQVFFLSQVLVGLSGLGGSVGFYPSVFVGGKC